MGMRVLQISTVCGSGSVGRIVVDLYRMVEENGDEGLIAYGRQGAPEGIRAFRFGTGWDMGVHVLSTFFRGEHGFASGGQTRKLIERIREWEPDVIHLHNIHGFVLQVEVLFAYLKEARKAVVWTLHDGWAYTGHCAFYDYTGCRGFENGCKECTEYQKVYPYALFRNRTQRNYIRKRKAFTGVWNLTLVTPSRWLAGEVGKSFLRAYPVRVIPNGVDQNVFAPVEGTLREQLGFNGKFVLLGVANVWERRKGFSYFMELAKRLSDDYRIVLVGLSKKQLRGLPRNVMGLSRTSSAKELAEYYSMADVFVNATLEDNFPTTNLEALSCGTPVITFDTGGSPESLDESCGSVVPKRDIEALLRVIEEERKKPKRREDCLKRARQYEKKKCFMEYIRLYHEVAEQGE